MLDVVKGIMQVIKDNEALKFAVITGCLRIAKESIFTGTNNFVSDTISDTRLNQYFGFTQPEVDKLLQEAGLVSHKSEFKEWYDGYRFGDVDVYCPWDVMNHVQNLMLDQSSQPKNFWENTSDNGIIRSFLERTSFNINQKFEILLAGGMITESIVENLTYDVLKSSEENLWSLLYLTGYLTKLLSDLLFDTISYHDYRESFYHAFLAGLVSNVGYQVESNYENGLGRSDLVIKDPGNRRAVVIEAKWMDEEAQLEAECRNALRQIEEKRYAQKVTRLGFQRVEKFGIAFFQKTCLVRNQ